MDYLSTYTPGSSELNRNVMEGIQPASRINEVVQNAFIDPFEWNHLPENVSVREAACTDVYQLDILRTNFSGESLGHSIPGDVRPDYHKWATALPGMIAVTRKVKDQSYRGYTAAETAVPVIVCSQAMVKAQDDAFFFGGVVRSKSVKTEDDGNGPNSDSHFTLHVGGICTILNNSPEALNAGDGVAWSFHNFAANMASAGGARKARSEPRRIQVLRVPPAVEHPRTFARVLNYARPGEGCDILVGPTCC